MPVSFLEFTDEMQEGGGCHWYGSKAPEVDFLSSVTVTLSLIKDLWYKQWTVTCMLHSSADCYMHVTQQCRLLHACYTAVHCYMHVCYTAVQTVNCMLHSCADCYMHVTQQCRLLHACYTAVQTVTCMLHSSADCYMHVTQQCSSSRCHHHTTGPFVIIWEGWALWYIPQCTTL